MKTIRIINEESPFYNKTGLGQMTWNNEDCMVHIDSERSFHVFYKNEIEVVGNPTVYDATKLAFNQIEAKEFPIRALLGRVRNICERPELMDGTILRRLREVREDGGINYEIADNHKAIYRKL